MGILTRRNILAIAATLPFSNLLHSAPTTESLGTIAAKSGIVFGSAAALETLDDPAYRQLYINDAKSITTDWALKFDALRQNEATYQFESADALINFATDHKMLKRGHTLVWNENAPQWLRNKSKSEIIRILDTHIDTVVARYKGKIDIWDVVNEPFWPEHGEVGGYRQGPWFGALGKDYIKRSLLRTAKADASVKLAINEAHTERSDELGLAMRTHLLRLIDELQHAGVKLDAIGLQGHLQPQFAYDDNGYVAFLQQIAARKLDIHITELDIDNKSLTGRAAEKDKQAASRVYDYLSHVLSVTEVKMITTWELSDKYTWYNAPEILSSLSNAPSPLPYDANFNKKPMWYAIARALTERKI